MLGGGREGPVHLGLTLETRDIRRALQSEQVVLRGQVQAHNEQHQVHGEGEEHRFGESVLENRIQLQDLHAVQQLQGADDEHRQLADRRLGEIRLPKDQHQWIQIHQLRLVQQSSR